jgi:hypothetical protein
MIPKTAASQLPMAALLVFLAVAGCRWEVSKVPLPRPSPTPSPSPSPSPAAASRVAGSAGVAQTGRSALALTANVVRSNADMLTEAFATAAGEAARFEAAVLAAPWSAPGDFPEAFAALRAAAEAYRRGEAAVFYVDPASAAELRAQPDPLQVGGEGGAVDPFGATALLLRQLAGLTGGAMDRASIDRALDLLEELEAAAAGLRSDMNALAAAWSAEERESFREKYFLASSREAAARIFQGSLALSGDILPTLLSAPETDPAELAGRTAALRDLYLGSVGADGPGPGLHDLVFASAPAQALATYGTIAQAVALGEALMRAPAHEETRRQLAEALANATRQLEFSAEAVGIQIVEVAD